MPMHAEAHVVVEPTARGGLRAVTLRTPAPLGARMAGGELHLLGTAAGPLGGDRLRLRLEVRAGAQLTVRSVAAALAQRGDGTASTHDVEVHVEPGASLRWLVEPLVAATGCDHATTATVHLDGDARLLWRDELVLGRSGEEPGRCTSTLRLVRDGLPLLHHELSTARPGWRGPGVLGAAGAVGQVAAVDVPLTEAPPAEAPPAKIPPAKVPPAERTRPGDGGAAARGARLDLGAGLLLGVAVAGDHAALRRLLPAEEIGLAPARGAATVSA